MQRINQELRSHQPTNQVRSTAEVLNWFKNLENKKDRHFIQFDIDAFYPSISQELLINALTWAKQYSYISDLAIKVILNARKTVLFDGQDYWTKKGNSKFDAGMGSYDGAECCEIVGLYSL